MLQKIDFVGKGISERGALLDESLAPLVMRAKPVCDECQEHTDDNFVIVVLKTLYHIVAEWWWVYLTAMWSLFFGKGDQRIAFYPQSVGAIKFGIIPTKSAMGGKTSVHTNR